MATASLTVRRPLGVHEVLLLLIGRRCLRLPLLRGQQGVVIGQHAVVAGPELPRPVLQRPHLPLELVAPAPLLAQGLPVLPRQPLHSYLMLCHQMQMHGAHLL